MSEEDLGSSETIVSACCCLSIEMETVKLVLNLAQVRNSRAGTRMKVTEFANRAVGGTRKWPLVFGALVVFAVIILAIAGLRNHVNNADKTVARIAPLVGKVRLGETEAQVRALLGKPDSVETTTDASGKTDYWTYGTAAAKGSWQFTFINRQLSGQTQY